MTIDTGAQISILKPEKLHDDTKIRFKDRVQITGISKDMPFTSIGRAIVKIQSNECTLEFGFHIVTNPLNVDTDGLIGSDFLEMANGIINYKDEILFLSMNKKQIPIGLKEANNEIYEQCETRRKNMIEDMSSLSCKSLQVVNEKQNKKNKNKNFYDEIDSEIIKSNCVAVIQPVKIEIKKLNSMEIFYNKNRDNEMNFEIENEMRNPTERKEYLLKNLNLEQCSNEEKNELEKVFETHGKAFYIDGDPFKHTNVTEHIINLKPGTKPIYTKQYRLPESQKEEAERQLNELIKNNIIEKSTSAWNSPFILVPKKADDYGKKQYRMVIDYRKLNSVTEPQTFPIPLIDEIIESMRGSILFSTLDLQNAFHQVPLHKDSRAYTAFSTSWQKYQFTSTPFGLTGSPFTWLRTIHTVLHGLLGKGVEVYMDDVLIHSKTLAEHVALLKLVLQRLIDNNLKLKIAKSALMRKSIKYL